ncbi:hypothetical protein ABZW11_23045 [Nonomuraea sp. NPDC004580]|uniref:hypothetical protein n=1 Tax=Nonomuraea sp. NPDC004580 TaxID=3154552 RepID=UPI0033ABC57C
MTANATTTTRYMFLMTVLIGKSQATVSGNIDVKPGASRLAVFNQIVENYVKRHYGTQNFCVLHFSLEVDVL